MLIADGEILTCTFSVEVFSYRNTCLMLGNHFFIYSINIDLVLVSIGFASAMKNNNERHISVFQLIIKWRNGLIL